MFLAVAAAMACEAAAAMPTKKDLSGVKPVVLELMRPFVKGLKAGTKTAAEVGDGAVGFAEKADTLAAKYMLLSGAVEYYAMAGECDKAADAIESILRLVPDIPAGELLAITSAAMKRANPGRASKLARLDRMAKARANAAKRLKTVEAALKAKPADDKLRRSRAELIAAAGDWKTALGEFAELGGKTGRIAQDERDGGASSCELAGFWWDYKPNEADAADAIAAHAALLYKKALDYGEVDGLKKILAEKRVAEACAAVYVAMPAHAQVKYKFDYKLNDKGEAVLRYSGNFIPCISPKPEGVLVVPDEIDGHKVVGFDDNAFINCDKMTRLVLPEHLERFGLWTVHGCISLERIDISKDNNKYVSVDGVLYSKDRRTLIAYPRTRKDISLVPECRHIGITAFSSCCFVAAKLPEGVEYIDYRAFDGCGNLEIVEFPRSFKSFRGPFCFLACQKLRIVRFLGDAPLARAYPMRDGAGKINFLTRSPEEAVIEVARGSKGWNGPGSTSLPARWPREGGDSRPVRYAE